MVYQIQDIKERVIEVLKRNDVKRAALFGSITRGEMNENSDIDLLIEYKGKKSLMDLAGLKLELEDTLKCKVDLLTFDSLHPLLKEKITKEQIEII